MTTATTFLVDVGMRNLPFPMRVASRGNPDGQATVGNISISAHVMQEFEAHWIDRFIQVLHRHREAIGTRMLKANVLDYVAQFDKAPVTIDFEYPFFIEKMTPAAKARSLVRYRCAYSVSASGATDPRILFKIEVPAITTYPQADVGLGGQPFGQLSVLTIEVEPRQEIFPEDLVDLVDRHALAPVYSFLTAEDQALLIERVHQEVKSSVALVGDITAELARNADVRWYAIHCANFGMLHSYSTVIGAETGSWLPFSAYTEELDREARL
jgi:GTP cyclohydrolase IB